MFEITSHRNPSAEHLAFAEVIAEEYDEIYSENSHYASKSYMNFEEMILQRQISSITNRHKAVDLGCGTGRLSIFLSSLFENVDAFDISKSMLEHANAKKEKLNIGNIFFSQFDLNLGIPEEDNSASFIYSSFGLGSFVEDINLFCSEMQRVLADNGKALISFYNRNNILNELKGCSWTPSLSAVLDSNGSAINVKVNGTVHTVYARSFTTSEVENVLGKYFNIISLTTFPTIASFLPDEVLNNFKIRNLCNDFDLFLLDKQLDMGAYIVAFLEKKSTTLN
jgi:ubiquinone/menaquinone biosynthesis C-methylase UbiE